MGSTKVGQGQDDELQGEEPTQHDSGVASSGSSSGVRVERERETTPAPASVSDDWASYPSERPTSVPTYDVAAVAFETSMRHHVPRGLPLDVAIPTRTLSSARVPTHLDHRASFLLLHVDGQSSVREIADVTGLPFADVEATFLSLTADGLVELGGTHAVLGVPASGERTRHDGDPEDD